VAAHEENFRATERFVQWRGAIGQFFAAPPQVEHFDDIDPERLRDVAAGLTST
jgi:hypothetical protein